MKRNQGFTLTEMLMALAILAILISLAVPGFDSMLKKRKIDAAKQSLMQLAQLARTTAVNEQIPSVICGSSSGERCDSGKRWQAYALAFQDDNFNHAYDNGEKLLFKQTLDNADIKGTSARIEFNPSGAGYMGSWIYCPKGASANAETFKMVVSLGGRVRSEIIKAGQCS